MKLKITLGILLAAIALGGWVTRAEISHAVSSENDRDIRVIKKAVGARLSCEDMCRRTAKNVARQSSVMIDIEDCVYDCMRQRGDVNEEEDPE